MRLLDAIPESAWSTWGVMLVLTTVAWLMSRRISIHSPSRLQALFELITEQLCKLTREIVGGDPAPYVPLTGTLFLFVFAANLVGMIPGLTSPAANLVVENGDPSADLSVTVALAVLVCLSVPFYGIRAKGVSNYLKMYLEPNPFMMPFNLLGEITRTLSLAIRLFGNIMSGEFLMLVVIGVVTTLLRCYARVFIPFTFLLTLFLSILSLITAGIQAYIFTVLALVYIGAAVEREKQTEDPEAQATA